MNKDLTMEEQKNHNASDESEALRKENQKLRTEIRSLHVRLKASEETAAKLEHLSSFSESASEIAHEINNPVNFVSGSLSIIKRGVNDFIEVMSLYQQLKDVADSPAFRKIRELEDDIDINLTKKELNDATAIIEKGMERIHEIAHNLSLLGKRETAAPIMLDVNKSLADTLMMIQEKVQGRIEIRMDLGNVPEIMSYRGKLNQVFTNIIKNAVEAIQAKSETGAEYLHVRTHLQDDHVVVTIRDSGNGMSDETKKRLFDKFYTTKSPGKGIGLGMGVSKAIVEKHKGLILVESERGNGTELTIKLPLKH